ncbi:MAG: hypothetical protein QOJ68_121, partial [Blastococcus sp.]|nr:hypothetical protein [Blastococcus sp.]
MRQRDRDRTSTTAEDPKDVEALERVLEALDGDVPSELDAHRRILHALVGALDLTYGGAWLPGRDGEFVLRVEDGETAPTMASHWRADDVLRSGDGYGGRALQQRTVVLMDEQTATDSCPRWATAKAAGARQGCFLPVIEGNRVTAVLEYYSRSELPFFGGRTQRWESIGRMVAHARRSAIATASLKETLDDRDAVTTVVGKVGEARDEATALRVALETVRTAFGWAYGSFWALDPVENVLRFDVESGSAGEEFRKVTLAASFAEGVGLSGRAWRARDLVFVSDLAEVTDCVRAPAAQRAGVRSGVCFPIVADGRVVGTMDFFTTETIELSDSRASALRNVQQLVSQRLDILRRA